jgi:hypothetical protein
MPEGSEDDAKRDPQSRARPDYHDPLAGFGGAPPAQSALTLRLVLASFGLVVCTGGAVGSALIGPIGFCVLFAVLAAAALVDIIVVVRRKLRGEPG